MTPTVPVIGLSGVLGAGKTTVLNYVLRSRGARVGVVVNDFGAVNVDAGLITGQIDEVAAITGGCVCCLPDTGGLDDALRMLTRPRLELDVVIVEASGVADPLSLAHLLRYSGAERARFGGIIEVIDCHAYRADSVEADQRLRAASLVVANKLDLVELAHRAAVVDSLRTAAQRSPTSPPVVATENGRLDPSLLFDVAHDDAGNELDFSGLFESGHSPRHSHASSAWVPAPHAVDADSLLDLLESPPPNTYRMKGRLALRAPRRQRSYLFNVVGRSIHVAPDQSDASTPAGLVCIGDNLDPRDATARMTAALRPSDHEPRAEGLRRLRRYLRLSR